MLKVLLQLSLLTFPLVSCCCLFFLSLSYCFSLSLSLSIALPLSIALSLLLSPYRSLSIALSFSFFLAGCTFSCFCVTVNALSVCLLFFSLLCSLYLQVRMVCSFSLSFPFSHSRLSLTRCLINDTLSICLSLSSSLSLSSLSLSLSPWLSLLLPVYLCATEELCLLCEF